MGADFTVAVLAFLWVRHALPVHVQRASERSRRVLPVLSKNLILQVLAAVPMVLLRRSCVLPQFGFRGRVRRNGKGDDQVRTGEPEVLLSDARRKTKDGETAAL